jgi:flagellar FliJ protein
MRRFRFALQAVLELREHVERQRKLVLASAIQHHARQITRVDAASAALDQALADSVHDPVASMEIRLAQMERLRGDIGRAQVDAMTAFEVVAQRRDELAAAQADRSAVEKLRERRIREHLIVEQRSEEASLNEAALALSVRRVAEQAQLVNLA